ncbi:MAG: hypothetical protein ACLFQA_09530 [Bacteroidales bacterium]
MQKIPFFLLVLLAALFTKVDCQPTPTVYPGAVPMTTGDEHRNMNREEYASFRYLSRDDFSKVCAYYANENKEPFSEQNDGVRGRSAFFSYIRRMPDDSGVAVHEMQGRSGIPSRIFSNLQGLTVQGALDKETVVEIEKKYNYLKSCYFVLHEENPGSFAGMDEIIFRKYEEKLGLGGSESLSQQDLMKKAQELISSGRVQEGVELLESFQKQQISRLETSISSEAADIWIECLEEIASHAYTVIININL